MYFTRTPTNIYYISSEFFSDVADKNYTENQNTFFTFCNLLPENRAIHEIMWQNVVDPELP